MTKREKIMIISAAIAAIAGGIYILLTLAGSSSEITKSVQTEKNDVSLNSVDTIEAIRSRDPLTILSDYIIQKAGDEWTNDPFLKFNTKIGFDLKKEFIEQVSGTKEKKKEEIYPFSYSGFLIMGGQKFVIINGIEYKSGEELEQTGYYVRRIYSDRVIIGNRLTKQSHIFYLEANMKKTEKSTGKSTGKSADKTSVPSGNVPGNQQQTEVSAERAKISN